MKAEWVWIALAFICAVLGLVLWIPAIIDLRRRRARKDVEHIIGAKQWWGRR